MDIRLIRGRGQRIWMWTSALVGLAALVYLASLWLGDPTTRPGRASGAGANFGADRASVVPMRPAPFESAFPLEDRELGRLLRLRGTAESRMAGGSLWVRTSAGRWILVRFEPLPKGAREFYPGAAVDVAGYLEKISRAEFDAWLDSLHVYLPRPRPGVKFGDLPDSGFIKVDTLFIRNYYISVRPEGVRSGAPSAADTPAAAPPRPAARAPERRAEPVPEEPVREPPPEPTREPAAAPPPADTAAPR